MNIGVINVMILFPLLTDDGSMMLGFGYVIVATQKLKHTVKMNFIDNRVVTTDLIKVITSSKSFKGRCVERRTHTLKALIKSEYDQVTKCPS